MLNDVVFLYDLLFVLHIPILVSYLHVEFPFLPISKITIGNGQFCNGYF
jgi:hypothetical protein